MKKLFRILLTALLLSAAACEDNSGKGSYNPPDNSSDNDTPEDMEYSVYFEIMDNAAVFTGEDYKVKYGSTIDIPPQPLHPGAIMLGWYKDKTLQVPWNFKKDTVFKDTTLYAKWFYGTLISDGMQLKVRVSQDGARTNRYILLGQNVSMVPIEDEYVRISYDEQAYTLIVHVKAVPSYKSRRIVVKAGGISNAITLLFQDAENGSAALPFLVTSVSELKMLGVNPSTMQNRGYTHYLLDADIDLSGEAWIPIEHFSGVLDGNGHSITGLNINQPGVVNAGLIAVLGSIDKESIIKNLYVEGNISAGSNSGIIAGKSINTSFTGVITEGTVFTAGDYSGGISGYAEYTKYTYSYSTADVTAQNYAGGLAGYIYDGSAKNCYSMGVINAVGNYVGGITGKAIYKFDGDALFSTGRIVSDTGDYVGGIVGYGERTFLNNIYTTGNITGRYYVGGILGYGIHAELKTGYTTGSVEADGYSGGIAGLIDRGMGTSILSNFIVFGLSINGAGGAYRVGDAFAITYVYSQELLMLNGSVIDLTNVQKPENTKNGQNINISVIYDMERKVLSLTEMFTMKGTTRGGFVELDLTKWDNVLGKRDYSLPILKTVPNYERQNTFEMPRHLSRYKI